MATLVTLSQEMKRNDRYAIALKMKGQSEVYLSSEQRSGKSWPSCFAAVVNTSDRRGCFLLPTGFLKANIRLEKIREIPCMRYLVTEPQTFRVPENGGQRRNSSGHILTLWARTAQNSASSCLSAHPGGDLKYDINVHVYFHVN